jgi:hypothetical protein
MCRDVALLQRDLKDFRIIAAVFPSYEARISAIMFIRSVSNNHELVESDWDAAIFRE